MSDLPKHLLPGKLKTMQAVNAKYDRDYYVDCPDYVGQPKRDGIRLIVFKIGNETFYQSRSLKMRKAPSAEFDEALKNLKADVILDGELLYLDEGGVEHRTRAQAERISSATERYCVFKALYFNGKDLTTDTELVRLKTGLGIVTH